MTKLIPSSSWPQFAGDLAPRSAAMTRSLNYTLSNVRRDVVIARSFMRHLMVSSCQLPWSPSANAWKEIL